jgi:tetratricopeptide (TPR) repeat protein
MSLILAFTTMDHAAAQSAASPSEELLARTHKAQVLLDQYYGNRDKIARAQQYVVEVLEAAPQFVPAYVQAARVMIMGGHIVSRQFASGTLEGAEGVLLKAKALEPDNAEVHGLLGHVYYLKGDLNAAMLSLETAKRLKSPNPWLNNNYGDLFLRLKQIELADRHYQLVTDLGAGTTAQQLRAYVYALQKRQWVAALREDNPEVLRLGKMAVDAAPPEDAWVWGDVASVLFIQGYFDESIAHSRKALSIMNYGVGRSNLALGLYGKWASMVVSGRGPEAEKYFAEAYALNPNLTQVVQRFAQSARVVVSLAPIVEKRQAELRR